MWTCPQPLPDAPKDGFSSQHLPPTLFQTGLPLAASHWPLAYASFFAGYLSSLVPLLPGIPILEALIVLNSWNQTFSVKLQKVPEPQCWEEPQNTQTPTPLVIPRPRAVIMGLPAGPPAPDHSPPLGQAGPLPWLWPARDWRPRVPSIGQARPISLGYSPASPRSC